MKQIAYFLLIALFFSSCQQEDGNVLTTLLNQNKDKFGDILKNPAQYEVQILYTQIDRDSFDTPTFTSFTYNIDTLKYFYPASLVNMPTSFLALEKLNLLYKHKGLLVTKDMQTITDSIRPPQTPVSYDNSAPNNIPTIGNYIKNSLVFNNSNAFNRLYEFVGQPYINNTLKGRGFKDTRIIHRLDAPQFSLEQNKYTNPVTITDNDSITYVQKEIYGFGGTVVNVHSTLKGEAFAKADGTIVNQPFDFSNKNFMSIPDMQNILKAFMFSQHTSQLVNFSLLYKDEYDFLKEMLSMTPRNSQSPLYDPNIHHDGFNKYLMYGDTKDQIPNNVKIYNQTGKGYGYLTDCAYIVDTKNGVEFLLTAVIHVNDNQTYNDKKYEYETIGLPFLGNLGRVIYDYELTR